MGFFPLCMFIGNNHTEAPEFYGSTTLSRWYLQILESLPGLLPLFHSVKELPVTVVVSFQSPNLEVMELEQIFRVVL